MPELNTGTSPGAEGMAPNNPEAQSAKPMQEADDFELLRYLLDPVAPTILLAWSSASAETKKLLANLTLDEKAKAAAIANAWREPINKLESLQVLAEHMMFRAEHLRINGILTGDPRERKALAIEPWEAS